MGHKTKHKTVTALDRRINCVTGHKTRHKTVTALDRRINRVTGRTTRHKTVTVMDRCIKHVTGPKTGHKMVMALDTLDRRLEQVIGGTTGGVMGHITSYGSGKLLGGCSLVIVESQVKVVE